MWWCLDLLLSLLSLLRSIVRLSTSASRGKVLSYLHRELQQHSCNNLVS